VSVETTHAIRERPRSPIRAEITGNTCTALGITARDRDGSPVLKLCRKLIEGGHDPATPLHAYRGDTLCLKVRSIGEAARLRVSSGGGFEPLLSGPIAPYSEFDGSPLSDSHPEQARTSERGGNRP
jgi:hypothetical protein